MAQQIFFCGGFLPVVHTYSSGSGATETVPAGAFNLKIECWGATAASQQTTGVPGGCGAAGGGYCVTNVAVSGGQTLTYTVGVGGTVSSNNPSNAGSASSVSSGTKTITTMTANSGAGATGTAVSGSSAGGTASGGTTSNVSGASVTNTSLGGNSGSGNSGFPGGGPNGTTSGTQTVGTGGQVQFSYT